jgi:hypothetical protein
MGDARIDHLVVAALSLGDGVEYVAETLGVGPRGGGEHAAMGTHNRVLRLGEDCYLEVIAVNPSAPGPTHPRWFELDTEAMQEKLRQRPRLITWAIRTNRIEEAARRSTYPLGEVKPMNRGNLHWRLTLTGDGHLPQGGLVPFLIQWDVEPHPASAMPESGCSLVGLNGFHHEPETVRHVLRSLGAEHLCEIKQSEAESTNHLVAAIETPGGVKMLS